MKTKVLCDELLKSRNNLVKNYLKIQAVSIHSLHSADEIMKRMDKLFDLQEAIKQFDILIGYAKKCSYSWDSLSLMTFHDDTEKWKPEIAKLSDWKDISHNKI